MKAKKLFQYSIIVATLPAVWAFPAYLAVVALAYCTIALLEWTESIKVRKIQQSQDELFKFSEELNELKEEINALRTMINLKR